MTAFSDFLDRSLSLWRRCGRRDMSGFLLACIIFIAGCVLATMSWKLGASTFVIPYVLLGTSGFVIHCLNVVKVIPEGVTELLPLLSPLHFKVAVYKKYKKCKATKTENSLNPHTEESSVNETSICSNNLNQKEELSPCSDSVVPEKDEPSTGNISATQENDHLLSDNISVTPENEFSSGNVPVTPENKASSRTASLTQENNEFPSNYASATPENELSSSNVSVTPENDICESVKCVQSIYNPRIVHEVYVTGPSPGGGQSRKSDGEGSLQWQRRLSPILDIFRTSSTEGPSAQFHIPLREISHGREGAESCQESFPGAQAEAQAGLQWMSSNPREPIYRNIIPYPERRRKPTESAVLRHLDYDIPSKEHRSVEGGMSKQRAIGSASVEGNFSGAEESNTSRSRLGAFTSPERIYVNVSPSGIQDQRHLSPPLGRDGVPIKTENIVTGKCSESWFEPTSQMSTGIYANVPSKNQRTIGTEGGYDTLTRLDRYVLPKTHELRSVSEPVVPSTSGDQYRGQKKASRVDPFGENPKSEIKHSSNLKDDNIYVNVSPSGIQDQRHLSPPLGRDGVPIRTENIVTGKCSESWFVPTSQMSTGTYANVPSKNQRTVGTEGGYDTLTRLDRHVLPKPHELRSVSEPAVQSTSGDKYRDQKKASRVGPFGENLKHSSPLKDDNIYMDISSLRHKAGKETTVQSDRGDNFPSRTEKLIASPESTSPLMESESTYENLLLRRLNSQGVMLPIKTQQQQVSSESEYSADTETDVSTSGEYAGGSATEAERKDTNRVRSEYMYVTGLGPTLKTYVKQGASDFRTVPLKSGSQLSMKLLGDSAAHATTPASAKSKTLPSRNEYTGSRPCERDDFTRKTSRVRAPLNTTEIIQSEPPAQVEENVQQELLSSLERFKKIGLLDSENNEEDPAMYRGYNLSDILPVETKRKYAKETTQNQNIVSHSSKGASSDSIEVESPEIKHGYENPLYDVKALPVEGTHMGSREKVERLVTTQETNKSNETFLVPPDTSSSCVGKLDRNQDSSEYVISTRQVNAIITSEDEDSFSLLKSLSENETPKGKDSRLATPENSSFTKEDCSTTFSKGFQTFRRLETEARGSTDPEHIFSPRKKQPTSRTSTASVDERPSGRSSFSTPLEIRGWKSFRSPEERTSASPSEGRNVPRILPPLDRSRSSSGLRPSLGNLPPAARLDLPVILNRSTIVQSQLGRFTAPNRGGSLKPAVHHSFAQPSGGSSLQFPSQSSKGLRPESQLRSSRIGLPSASTDRSPGHRFLPANPRIKLPETSIAPPKPKMATDQHSDIPDTTTADSPSKQSEDFSGGNRKTRRHSPVYF